MKQSRLLPLWLLSLCLTGLSGCTGSREEYSYKPLPAAPPSPPPRVTQSPLPNPTPAAAPAVTPPPTPTTAIIRRAGHTNIIVQLPQTVPLPDGVIAFDAMDKAATVPFGTPEARIDFNLTNISPAVVAIRSAVSSCFCTVAELPASPWLLQPGESGQIHVTMDLRGKSGRLTKAITVNTDKGTKLLLVDANILPVPAKPVAPMDERERARERNQAAAKVDRQAVLRGDCARCHVEPGRNKFGKELYVSVCGVCHEAERRATMVPNLHTIPQKTDAEFWRNWVVNGKAGTLMPAFTLPHGGFLSQPQVDSLVDYLVANFPSAGVTNAAPVPQ